MKHEHFLGSACRFMLRKKEKNPCASKTLAWGALLMKICVCNCILHAATSPCKCSDYHRNGLSINLLLPMLSDYFVSVQLATVSSLVSFTVHLQYAIIGSQRWLPGASVCTCARQRWQWSDLIDRGVEESIWGLLRAPEAACCVLLNLIPLYWRTNWKSVSLSSSTHLGGTIKGDNCCLALSSRPNIFFFPFSTQPPLGQPLTEKLRFLGPEAQHSQRYWLSLKRLM